MIFVLFLQDYFSYFENSVNYKNKIIDYIEKNIGLFPSKNTPPQIQHLGSKYIFYKSNAHTTWFIFFEQKDDNFLITNIINNHSEEAIWLK